MARDKDLFQQLRDSGLRKRTAKATTKAIESAPGGTKAKKQVKSIAKDLRKLASELEDRAKGGPAKRSASAKKAARTRKRKAQARSASAKKAAQTRAKAKR